MTSGSSSPEIVIGLVGRIGIDRSRVMAAIKRALRRLQYDHVVIHLTDHLEHFPSLPPLDKSSIEKGYASKITACNELRDQSENPSIMMLIALLEIERARRGNSERGIRNRTAYIIDQIKRPEESKLLRSIYGNLFIQISCHDTEDKRTETLTETIAKAHPDKGEQDWCRAEAEKLIRRDDHEDEKESGQRVREVFTEGDLFINVSSRQVGDDVERFFDLFFGSPAISPTKDEYGMALASFASQRSLSPSRQVGAAIMSIDGEVASMGCNEVAKSEGGTYWHGDENDSREVKRGYDINYVLKRNMVSEIIEKLRDNYLNEASSNLEHDELLSRLLNEDEGALRDIKVMDTLEFGREVHAEMVAITDAARNGISIKGKHLFCNTFPCHNCTKHIIASGVSRVIYLKPFPKSFAKELFKDSIVVDMARKKRKEIPFEQFIGVAPRRFSLFEKGKLPRDDKGNFPDWVPDAALPNVPPTDFYYFDYERQIIQQTIDDLSAKLREAFDKIRAPE